MWHDNTNYIVMTKLRHYSTQHQKWKLIRNPHFIIGGSFTYGRRRKGETFKEGDRMMMVIRYIIKLILLPLIRISNINTKMILSYC